MKPRRKKNDANSTKQRKRNLVQRKGKKVFESLFLHRRGKIYVTPLPLQRRGRRFFTSSDTLILMKRFCKFYHQQGNTSLVKDFRPCFKYAKKYLKKKYSLDHIYKRMGWLQNKYVALRMNVEHSNFGFKNKYEALIYKWGDLAWGNVSIDAIPMMIDLIKTPMKEETVEHKTEKGGQEIGKKDDEPIINVSDSESEMKAYESEGQVKANKGRKGWGYEQEIGDVYDSESEMKTYESDGQIKSNKGDKGWDYEQEIGDSENELKAYESEGRIKANKGGKGWDYEQEIGDFSGSENEMKAYESEGQTKANKGSKGWGYEQEIEEKNAAAIIYVSDSENETKTYEDDAAIIYVSDSENEMKACESEG